jgi:glucosamine--fructose-6-phosphate aminotransferase (isomerizing)
VTFTRLRGRPKTKSPQHVTWDPVMAEKAGYPHFMLKEIYEQPWAVRETVLGRTSAESGRFPARDGSGRGCCARSSAS